MLKSQKAMGEDDKPIVVEVDGIKFTSISRYYDGDTPQIAHRLKDNDPETIDLVARRLSEVISPFCVIVPVPNRCGYARETLDMAKALSKQSGVPIADVLRGNKRESLYQVKKEGRILTEEELGFRQVAKLPFYRTPVFLDNVVATGLTAKAAYHAVGRGEVLTYAIDDQLLEKSQSLMEKCSIRR